MSQNNNPIRQAFGSPFSFDVGHGWATRLMVSVGMAGFLALMGVLSFPLPWTPVPFSMMPLGLLIAGGYQRPGYAGLSVVIYLAAGALGAPIYANGSSGWEHLFGATGGYLIGFVLVSSIIGWYMGRPRRFLPAWAVWTTLGLLGLGTAGGIATIALMGQRGGGLGSFNPELAAWGYGASTLWILVFVTAVATALGLWLALRRKGEEKQALNLYLVMLASIIVLHICGVTVLWLVGGLELLTAIVLGSVVFLPFDAVKAGLAVGLTLPFVPTPAPGAKPDPDGGVA